MTPNGLHNDRKSVPPTLDRHPRVRVRALSLRVVRFFQPAHHNTGAAAKSEHAHWCSSVVHAPPNLTVVISKTVMRVLSPQLPTCHAASGRALFHQVPTDSDKVGCEAEVHVEPAAEFK